MHPARLAWPVSVVVVLVAVAGLGACGVLSRSEREPGCASPPNEGKLLDAYEEDPLLRVNLVGAERAGGPSRWEACHRLSREDVSRTTVNVSYRLAADLDTAALHALFDPVATANGWTTDPATGSAEGGGAPDPDPRVGYCKRIRGQLSHFEAYAQPALSIDVRPSLGGRPSEPALETTPGGLYVSIQWWPSGGHGGICG